MPDPSDAGGWVGEIPYPFDDDSFGLRRWRRLSQTRKSRYRFVVDKR